MGRPREPDSDLLAKPKKCWCKSTPGTCIGSRNRNYCIVRMRKSELREVPIFRAGNRPPISSREPTRSQLGRLICSLAPHISLIKTAYRAPSNQAGLDRVPLGTDARHFVRCRKGLRLHGAVSDKVRDELCFILECCGIRTIAERPLSHKQMTSFRQREGAFLLVAYKTINSLSPPHDFTCLNYNTSRLKRCRDISVSLRLPWTSQ